MLVKRRIYLDTAAATPLDLRVEREMEAYNRHNFANPASLHREGVTAARALAIARARVATCLGAHPDEIIFTSGGTEANNLALSLGHPVSKLPESTWTLDVQVITTAIEHVSVLEPAKKLKAIFLPVDQVGLVDLKKLKASLTPDTKLVSIIYAHNEIGVIQPIKEIAKIIRHYRKNLGFRNSDFEFDEKTPFFHLDACQAPRFLDINVKRLGVDLMTVNASKIYGPRGTGALYVRRGVKLQPQLIGGGQEADRRAGTENVAGAVGLAVALEICERERKQEVKKLSKLRDQLITGLLKIEGVTLNGPGLNSQTERLANNVNVSVAGLGLEGEQLVIELDARGISCSTGAACSIPDHDDSHVIMALGKTEAEAKSAVRFTLGRETNLADIKYVLKSVSEVLKKYC